jgi:hypothetical protein
MSDSRTKDPPVESPDRAPRRAAAPGSASHRRAPRETLSPESELLVAALAGAELPITALAARFPHVVNRLSACWNVPLDVVDVLDELLTDRRGGRRGFPADALAEVLTLREAAMRRAAAKGAAREG